MFSATDKCRLPFYGGCPFTIECLSSVLTVDCPTCISGFVEDPADPGGVSLIDAIIISQWIPGPQPLQERLLSTLVKLGQTRPSVLVIDEEEQ